MKIFISHSWNDKSLATDINETLVKDGHEVWFDVLHLIPGDNIQTVIDAYIKKCDVVVLLWTIHAFASEGVEAEILTAKRLQKRIIPVQADATPLDHQKELKGLLGIPFDDKATGKLLLQRALLMLMAVDGFKEAVWFKEAFGNVVDLGGYLNYANTYRLKQNKNEDGTKEEWVNRLEALQKSNAFIREQIMPKAQEKMQTLQTIMQQLESGDASLDQLNEWRSWCIENKDLYPEMMQQLNAFIDKDIERIQQGGSPVSTLDMNTANTVVTRIENAINLKKEAAYQNTFDKIKKYAGLFLNEKMIASIANGYMNYVTGSPKVLRELTEEAAQTEYIAVKEATVQLLNYLEKQDHEKEFIRPHLEGYFDDAYLINNTLKLLIEAKLVKKERFSLDFVSANLVDNYVKFLLDTSTKATLEKILADIRALIGLKKNEINWGKVAAVVIGAAVVGSAASALLDGVGEAGSLGADTNPGGQSRFFEDRVADFSAKYGGGLDVNVPVQY